MKKFVKASEKKEAFLNLASLYAYEASLSVEPIGRSINENGMYYNPNIAKFIADDSDAYVLYEGEKAVGIVGFTSEKENTWMMDEIFVIKAYRDAETMEEILSGFLKEKHGTFQTHILKCQPDVSDEIEQYFKDQKICFEKTELDPIAWLYTAKI